MQHPPFHPAVDWQDGAADVTCPHRGQQEADHRGDFFRASDFLHRNGLRLAGDRIGVTQCALGHRRQDPAGCDGVGAAARGKADDLVLQARKQAVHQSGLGGGVVGVPGFAEQTGGRADEHEGRCVSRVLREVSEEPPAGQEGAGQVDVEGLAPAREVQVLERPALGRPHARVDDEAVDLRKRVGRLLPHPIHGGLVGQVRLDDDRGGGQALGESPRDLRASVGVEDQARAVRREVLGHGGAESAARPCHEHGRSLESGLHGGGSHPVRRLVARPCFRVPRSPVAWRFERVGMPERQPSLILRRAGLALALLLGAESIAQFVAWRVWRTEWIGPHGEPDAQTVLLVGAGECYDERVASREDAWPVEAVASLEGAPVRLVAGAAPGRDSEDILRRLPLQLSVERPARVVLCVGVEDYRRRQAAPVRLADLPGRNVPFARRVRLFDAFRGADRSAPRLEGPAQLHGAWHFGDLEFRFEPDGGMWMGQAPALWTYGEEEIGIEVPGVGAYRAAWRIEGQQLQLTGDFPGEQVLLMRGPNPGGAAALGAAQIDAGRFDEAEWMLRPAVLGSTADMDAAVTLVELLHRAGRFEDAEPIRARVLAESTEPRHAARRARLLLLDDPGAALDVLGGELAPHAQDALLMRALRAEELGDATDDVLAAAVRAMDGTDGPFRRTFALLAADLLDRMGDRDAAAVALCRGLAAVAGPPDGREIPALFRALDEDGWERAVRDAAVEPNTLAQVRASVASLDESVRQTLDTNLRAMVALIRFYGAEPILLDPEDDGGPRTVRRQVGRDLGVRVVSTDGVNRAALAGGLRAALDR